jgi:hypothetical protein
VGSSKYAYFLKIHSTATHSILEKKIEIDFFFNSKKNSKKNFIQKMKFFKKIKKFHFWSIFANLISRFTKSTCSVVSKISYGFLFQAIWVNKSLSMCMMFHFNVSVWHMWVWYLGEPDDAGGFKCEIGVKKRTRDEESELKYSGRVHSIRIPPHRIILSGCLLSFSDYTAAHFR